MSNDLAFLANSVDQDGFAFVRSVFNYSEITELISDLANTFKAHDTEAIRRSAEGHVFAARNLLELWTKARTCWRQPRLIDALNQLLGCNCGLLRGLFFDKPPERTWSLPWHKDMTIAVRDNSLASRQYSKPTSKCGVPHIEAPVDVLNQMLTLRIFLDSASEENGALVVIPGSHRQGKNIVEDDSHAKTLSGAAGDVLLIRPLVTHCSASSQSGTTQHRRVVHLEFSACSELPAGFVWFEFTPVN